MLQGGIEGSPFHCIWGGLTKPKGSTEVATPKKVPSKEETLKRENYGDMCREPTSQVVGGHSDIMLHRILSVSDPQVKFTP